MTDLPCPRCGKTHDLTDLEPSFRRPDPFVAIPVRERAARTIDGNDHCAIRDAADTQRRYFLRVLLPVPVRGQEKPCNWGIWAEVSPQAYQRALELWRDPNQASEPPFPGRLANTCPGYPETQGLPGLIQLVDPSTIPTFHFLPEVQHPLADEQRNGVAPGRVLEWMMPWLHPAGGGTASNPVEETKGRPKNQPD
jgi:hypothetical protein